MPNNPENKSNVISISSKLKKTTTSPQSPEYKGIRAGTIIKTDQLYPNPSHSLPPSVQVNSYRLTEMLGKRIDRPGSLPPPPQSATSKSSNLRSSPSENISPSQSLKNLRENLNSLNDLQSRFRFMLQDLEDLVKNER